MRLVTCAWPQSALLVFAIILAVPTSAQNSKFRSFSGVYDECTPSEFQAFTRISNICASCLSSRGVCNSRCCIVEHESRVGKQVTICEVGGCCIRRIGDDVHGIDVMDNLRYAGSGTSGGTCRTTSLFSDNKCERCAVAYATGRSAQLDCANGIDVPAPGLSFFAPARCSSVDTAVTTTTVTTTEKDSTKDSTATTVTATTTKKDSDDDTTTNVPTTTTDSTTPSTSPDNGETRVESTARTCFPAAATVQLESGEHVRMDELQIGNVVHVGYGQYSPVFMFTHRDAKYRNPHEYIRIQTASGHVLIATAGHYIYVDADDSLRAARDVREGDAIVLGTGTVSQVVAVQRGGQYDSFGLYNPHTLHGDIVVDGVLSSTYTTAVQPSVAHVLLAPLRSVFSYAKRTATVLRVFAHVDAESRS